MDGALTVPYSLDNLDEFAKSSIISDVVVGTVIATKTYVVEPGAEVYTDVVIEVTSARTAEPGSRITIRENGGIVTLAQVKSVMEGRLSAEEIRKQADTTIDFSIKNQPHTQKGQSVLFFVGGQVSDPGGQYAAARMIDEKDDGQYSWMGEPFNDAWVRQFSSSQATSEFALKN